MTTLSPELLSALSMNPAARADLIAERQAELCAQSEAVDRIARDAHDRISYELDTLAELR